MQELADGAPGLIDGYIGVGAGTGIGVRDSDFAERLPADHPRLLFVFPIGIEQCIRREGIAVRPAIYGDALDILRRVESCSAEHTAQLVADVSLEFRKRRLQQLRAPGAVLVALRQSGLARSS